MWLKYLHQTQEGHCFWSTVTMYWIHINAVRDKDNSSFKHRCNYVFFYTPIPPVLCLKWKKIHNKHEWVMYW